MKWSVEEAAADDVTKKMLAEYILEEASDEFKEQNQLSKGAIKKKPKEFWLDAYVLLLQSKQ